MADGSRNGGRTILIVDSDPAFRQLAARALSAAGLATEEVASGEEALQRLERGGVGLVVLDVRLPGISGYEVCRHVRARHGDRLPLVFVSGERVESFDRVAGLLVGADDYLGKPIAPDELTARVRRRLSTFVGNGNGRARLTTRELQILRLLADGLGPVEIGRQLVISPKTVGTHVEHIYTKLEVHSRAQAVAKAFRLELVDTA